MVVVPVVVVVGVVRCLRVREVRDAVDGSERCRWRKTRVAAGAGTFEVDVAVGPARVVIR